MPEFIFVRVMDGNEYLICVIGRDTATDDFAAARQARAGDSSDMQQ